MPALLHRRRIFPKANEVPVVVHDVIDDDLFVALRSSVLVSGNGSAMMSVPERVVAFCVKSRTLTHATNAAEALLRSLTSDPLAAVDFGVLAEPRIPRSCSYKSNNLGPDVVWKIICSRTSSIGGEKRFSDRGPSIGFWGALVIAVASIPFRVRASDGRSGLPMM